MEIIEDYRPYIHHLKLSTTGNQQSAFYFSFFYLIIVTVDLQLIFKYFQIMSIQHQKAIIISLFCLFLLEFFHLSIYPYDLITGQLRIIYFLPFFLLGKGKWLSGTIIGKKLFVCYFVFAILNIITCYYFRHQNIIISLIAWNSLFYVFYYLIFRTWRQPIELWENVIEFLFVIIIILFALKNIFIDWDFIKTDLSYERLEIEKRVRIFSDAILELGYLYSLNKYLVKSQNKYLILVILAALFIFLQGFRMMIVVGLFITFVMLFSIKKMSTSKKIGFVAISLFTIFIAMQLSIVNDRMDEIVKRNENANFSNENYVRVFDIQYTYTEFFKNKAELILGAGRTIFFDENDSKSSSRGLPEYAKERIRLATDFHYYPVDLGFLGLSWESGIPFTIVMLLMFLYLFAIKVDRQYYYLKYYGLYMVLIGSTNAQGYYQSNLVFLAIVYTIAELANKSYQHRSLSFQHLIS